MNISELKSKRIAQDKDVPYMARVIAKPWLLDFYCGYGYKVSRMSEKHT